MKYILTLAIMFVCSVGYSQVVIQGQINNYDGVSKVHYSPTVDGILAIGNKSNTIQPSASGGFEIMYKSSGVSSTRLGFQGLTYSFIHDENSQINFIIDQARIKIPGARKPGMLTGDNLRDSVKQVATLTIDGDHAALNRFNNSMVRTSTVAFNINGDFYSHLIAQAKTPSKAVSILDSLTQIELDYIDRLTTQMRPEDLNSPGTHAELKTFLKTQVHSFYGTVFFMGMMLKRQDQARLLWENPDAPDTVYNQTWEKLIEDYFLNASQKISPAPAGYEYNEFIQSSVYTSETYRQRTISESKTSTDALVWERLVEPRVALLDSLKLINEKAVLAYKVNNLSDFLHTQTFYSRTLLSAVNILKEQYPDSELIKPHAAKIDALKNYLKKSASSYDKFKIIDTNFTTFQDLLNEFKGKNIFIDIWATWCSPCIEDFDYKYVLRPFIDQKNITVLYISIDKQRFKNKWEENIKFNELDGYHVLANNLLIQDMWKALGGREGMIPRYALIDKTGSIHISNAARPGAGDKLAEQIRNLLATQ